MLKYISSWATHQGGDEAPVQLPHHSKEAHDVLLDDADAVARYVHEQGVGGGLDGVRVPLLVILGQHEGSLAVLVHHIVEGDGLAGPVHLVT